MKKHLFSFLLPGIFAACIIGCAKDADKLPYKGDSVQLPATALNYANPAVPAHFQDVVDSPSFDVTDDGATLGRVLFYDKRLSLNNKIACASCHHQERAFADPAAGSTGFEGKITPRNSLAIINPAVEPEFFWDLRESSLSSMVLKPIKNHIEMGMEDLDKLSGKLSAASYYPELFENAFGSPGITKERVSSALEQFLRSMLTCNSKADQGLQALTQKEQLGQQVFFGKGLCYTCHGGRNFNESFSDFLSTFPGGWGGRKAANIGLDMDYADEGIGASEQGQEGVFKIPSLRNAALTAPYMDDGRFKTLEEVVEHYNSSIEKHPNLDGRLRDWEGNPWRLQLTGEEKGVLVAFLQTLTDNQLVADERFSNPFAE